MSVFRPWRALRVDGGLRRDIPPHHPAFPPGDSPELRNVIVVDGVNRKWPGLLAYPCAPMPTEATFLLEYRGLGERVLVGSDGRSAYRWNRSGSYWALITPAETNPEHTVSKPANSANVIIENGTWQYYGAKPGDLIQPSGSSRAYEIASIEGTTAVLTETVAEGWSHLTFWWFFRFSESAQRQLRACQTGQGLVFTNGADPPMIWQPSEDRMRPLGGSAPRGRYVTTFHQRNLLVLASLDTDPQALEHSAAGDYETWPSDPDPGYAARYDFRNLPGPITGVDGGHEYLWVFARGSIWRGVWSATDVAMSFDQVPVAEGLIAESTLLRLGSQPRSADEYQPTLWAYWGERDIYVFNGESEVAIGEPIRNWLFDALDLAYGERIHGAVVPAWKLAFWSFPTRGSEGVCTDTIAYDYANGRWFHRDRGYTSFGHYDLTGGDEAWDELTGTIDEQDRVFDALGTWPQPVVLASQGTTLYYLAFGANDAGEPVRAYRRTPTYSAQGNAVEAGEVVLATTGQPGSRYAVELWGGENPMMMQLLEEKEAVLGASGDLLVSFSSAAPYLAFAVRNDWPSEEFGLVDIAPKVLVRGR